MDNENLYHQIENIIFDEHNLNVLKSSINSLSKGTLTPKVLKEQIIEFKLNSVQEIVKLFNFYHKQLMTATSLDDYTKNPNDHLLEQTLSEKNEFLQVVAKRIQKLYSNLKLKLENNT